MANSKTIHRAQEINHHAVTFLLARAGKPYKSSYMTRSESRPRNREATRAALLDAAKTTLAEQGFQNFGVNSVARQAGCDKQLIYRYFDGLDGLLAAIGQDIAIWLAGAADSGETAPNESYTEKMVRFADSYLTALRGNPLMQKILLWELSAPPEQIRPLSEARGRAMFLWMKRARGDTIPPPGADYALINASVVAVIHQMVLSAAVSGGFSGLPLQSDADWQRLRDGIRMMITQLYAGFA